MDGVADYCRLLGEALERSGHPLEVVEVGWDEHGWIRALRNLGARRLGARRVLMQYTAYSWSRYGMPFLFLAAALLVRLKRGRLTVVFHDALPHPGSTVLARLRGAGQRFVMRWAYRLAAKAVITVPTGAAKWLPGDAGVVTIPVGSNVVSSEFVAAAARQPPSSPTVVVFGVTGGPSGSRELDDIARALASTPARLVLFGSGTQSVEGELRRRLPSHAIDVHGVVTPARAQELLESATAHLFVRGSVSTGRTTAVAAVVAGTPLVGYRSELTGPPITDAGVRLVDERDVTALGDALAAVLGDAAEWARLHERSRDASRLHFCWPAVARAYLEERD